MKNNRIILILFILLAAVAGYFFYTKKSGTIKKELSDFAVADTASINKIFMADREGNTVTLIRQNSGMWRVNNKYNAKPEGINTLLYTIKALEVRSPVGHNLYNNTMKLLSSKSTKIEIYQKGNLVKTYYVGHPTMDNLGTFMYLEGSSVPFIMHIPGFNGFLSSRYYAIEQEWRDKGLLHCDPQQITHVLFKNLFVPDSSLEITKIKAGEYTVGNGKRQLALYDRLKLNAYISACSNVYYNKIDNEMSAERRDSILKAGPFMTLLIDTVKEALSARLFRKPVTASTRSQYDEATGKIWDYDLDRFYLLQAGDTTWYTCQYFQYDKLLKTPNYFLPVTAAK